MKTNEQLLDWRTDQTVIKTAAKRHDIESDLKAAEQELATVNTAIAEAEAELENALKQSIPGNSANIRVTISERRDSAAKIRERIAELCSQFEPAKAAAEEAVKAARDTAKTNLKREYRAAVKELLNALEPAAQANEKARQIYLLASASFPPGSPDRFAHAAALPILYLNIFEPNPANPQSTLYELLKTAAGEYVA